ncbi:hypothetical protein E1176_09320 [Fulvivirga sp. RKSG066]|uniref:hypothetical protein n=1 Tax=Fulvivirga aurantia TaxID=2529383 RepID=UPI0012BD76D1|nr:hypothetical protein [Fulvivirga aurantia]MTI21218.1 hypothetical protein [Fulvivirga aurantia]
MELEEMKNIWSDMSDELDKQKKLTQKLIIKMAHEKSSSRLGRIVMAESIGTVITVVALIFIGINFNKFNSLINIVAASGTFLILFVSVIMAVLLIRKANLINIQEDTYIGALNHYTDLKKMLRFYKRFSIAMYVIMPFFLIPVVSVLAGKDLSQNLSELWEVILACVLILPVAWLAIAWFYKTNLRNVTAAFKEVKNIENDE